MKKVYIKPSLESEIFVPQNYIAACGDHGTIYKFTCNAGEGKHGDVFTNAGKNLTKGDEDYYHACYTKHDAPSDDEFIRGTFYYNDGNDQKGYYNKKHQWIPYKSIDVIIWTDHGTNVHCTTNLNMEDWETTKS